MRLTKGQRTPGKMEGNVENGYDQKPPTTAKRGSRKVPQNTAKGFVRLQAPLLNGPPSHPKGSGISSKLWMVVRA